MDEQGRKLVTKYVEDMHSLVAHGIRPFTQQLGESEGKGHDEAHQAVQQCLSVLERHESMLTQRLKALGTSPTTAVQDAAATVAGVVAGLYNRVRTEAVSKSLRDDYTYLSHCSVSWMMLLTTARSLGDHETEELAEQGYRDCATLVMQVDKVMPQLVVQELRQDGLAAEDVTAWASGIVHRAWQGRGAGAPPATGVGAAI